MSSSLIFASLLPPDAVSLSGHLHTSFCCPRLPAVFYCPAPGKHQINSCVTFLVRSIKNDYTSFCIHPNLSSSASVKRTDGLQSRHNLGGLCSPQPFIDFFATHCTATDDSIHYCREVHDACERSSSASHLPFIIHNITDLHCAKC